MRITSFLLLIGAASAAVPSVLIKSCAANNCLRAIAATAPVHLTRRQSEDCSSFFQSYTTSATIVDHPIPSSRTVHIITAIDAIGLEPCAVTPLPTHTPPIPNFPNYVVAGCTGDVVSRFSSACSCIGVRETAPVVSITKPAVTVTATEFHIKVRETVVAQPRYLAFFERDGSNYGTAFTEDINEAIIFYRHADGSLWSEYGQVAPFLDPDSDLPFGAIYYGYPEDPVFYCSIEPVSFDLGGWSTGSGAPGEASFESFAVAPGAPPSEEIPDGFPPVLIAGLKGIDWTQYEADGVKEVHLQAVPIDPECQN
ncbi:hypothetical protein TWF506_002468 [Arthrobotrys conoides]|uniref:Uncharacterized protein n=1 Tax=Arthrobotrys conoides TaxID=74498 RepID=A0AAN8RJT9_9PEZI